MIRLGLLFFFLICILLVMKIGNASSSASKSVAVMDSEYWMVLERKSNFEHIYFGKPGVEESSLKLRTFRVKSGVPKEKPTPLPNLLGRDYWFIIGEQQSDNPETAPYFLKLDIPVSEDEPFGPVPYLECGGQCNWELPGYFGLHGVGGNVSKLSAEDTGSSGCIRHSDEDITFLYNLLDLHTNKVRYYIHDV